MLHLICIVCQFVPGAVDPDTVAPYKLGGLVLTHSDWCTLSSFRSTNKLLFTEPNSRL